MSDEELKNIGKMSGLNKIKILLIFFKGMGDVDPSFLR